MEKCPECRGELTSWFCDPCGNTGEVPAESQRAKDVRVITKAIHDLGRSFFTAAGPDIAVHIADALEEERNDR